MVQSVKDTGTGKTCAIHSPVMVAASKGFVSILAISRATVAIFLVQVGQNFNAQEDPVLGKIEIEIGSLVFADEIRKPDLLCSFSRTTRRADGQTKVCNSRVILADL